LRISHHSDIKKKPGRGCAGGLYRIYIELLRVKFSRSAAGLVDYTEWRKTNLCPGMALDEISEAAGAYCRKTHNIKT
jgi:hypothetical protein